MKIEWIGHSCFKVESGGYSIITDPYSEGSVPGLAPVKEEANLILCSHEHGDHNARTCVTVKETPENAVCPFQITKIETYHDEVKGAKRGPNVIHILDDGENKVAHFGDLGCELEPEQLEKLKGLDVALIPVGGFYTIDAVQAADLVRQIKPRIVVPMHYRSEADAFGFQVIGTVDTFTECMRSVMTCFRSEIESIYEYDAQVIVLQPKNRIKSGMHV
ncbi:MAG: MBL fold metallo-hydrolase [bacterium]|nr:MBL fold metallo-hydrolase [bacterium]